MIISLHARAMIALFPVTRSGTQVDAELLSHASNLKMVARAGVGIDNVDVPAASERGIIVVNAPFGNTNSAAEHSMAILLAMCRNVADANASLGYLFAEGKLVRLNEENYFHRTTFDHALSLLVENFQGKEFSLAEFRDKLGSARKAVQALLEYFDAQKYTMRKGDVRVIWKLPGGKE